MPLAATIVWENRPATGAVNQGGGFNSAAAGVDRSQQAAAQVVIDNVAIICTTPGAGSNTLTFTAGYVPTADDVGNVVAITGGTNINAGLYEITGFTGTTWTVTGSTNLTTAGGAGSAVTGNMGGARNGYSTGTTTMQSRLLSGHIVHTRNEAWNEAVALTVAGTAAAPIQHLGYNLTRGDNPTGANRPNNNRGGAASIAFNITAAGNILRNLIGSNPAGANPCWDLNGVAAILVNCRGTGGATEQFRMQGVAAVDILIACEGDGSTTGQGFSVTTTGRMFCIGCYAHDNASQGFLIAGAGTLCLIDCISEANLNHGLQSSNNAATVIVVGGTIDGNTGVLVDGINLGSPIGLTAVISTILSNNGRDGARAAAGNNTWFDFCDYFGNVGAARTGGIPTGANDQALDPQFTNQAGGDFSIGTNLAGLGFPGVLAGGLSTGYRDMGAVERQAAVPSTTTVVINPSAVWKW